MTAVVAVRPNVILGRQYLLSPQIEPSIFIFWENIPSYSQKYLFSIEFQSALTEIFAKGKTGRVLSCRDSRLSAQSADRRRVNKIGLAAAGTVSTESIRRFAAAKKVEFIKGSAKTGENAADAFARMRELTLDARTNTTDRIRLKKGSKKRNKGCC
jgi:hypothetical protein